MAALRPPSPHRGRGHRVSAGGAARTRCKEAHGEEHRPADLPTFNPHCDAWALRHQRHLVGARGPDNPASFGGGRWFAWVCLGPRARTPGRGTTPCRKPALCAK